MAFQTHHTPTELLSKLLEVTEKEIVPLTQAGVESGSKVFGAAVLVRDTLETHTVATNNERDSPLLHGEINCIQTFFAKPAQGRPATKDCIFFCTHEPCSLCLSGITWAGFNEFYYLFTYEDSRDMFSIPYDIDILQEVFQVKDEGTTESVADNSTTKAGGSPAGAASGSKRLYNKTNKFFRSAHVGELLTQIQDPEENRRWAAELERTRNLYEGLSETYQVGKKVGAETASVWK